MSTRLPPVSQEACCQKEKNEHCSGDVEPPVGKNTIGGGNHGEPSGEGLRKRLYIIGECIRCLFGLFLQALLKIRNVLPVCTKLLLIHPGRFFCNCLCIRSTVGKCRTAIEIRSRGYGCHRSIQISLNQSKERLFFSNCLVCDKGVVEGISVGVMVLLVGDIIHSVCKGLADLPLRDALDQNGLERDNQRQYDHQKACNPVNPTYTLLFFLF